MKTYNAYEKLKCLFSVSKMLFLILTFWIAANGVFAQKSNAEIFNLKNGENLQALPLDSVFIKLTAAINNMKGETDFHVKKEAQATLTRALGIKNPMFIAKANQQLANWHYQSIKSEKKDSIYYYDNEALKYLLKTEDKELISKAYRTLGVDLMEMQKFAKAEAVYFKGLKVAESINFESGINGLHANLAILYLQTKDYKSALDYNTKVVAAYEKDENTHPLIRALITTNVLQAEMGKPEEALKSINKALSLVPKLPEDRRVSETLNVRAWRGKVYRQLKRYDEALADFEFSWKGMKAKYGDEMANGWKGDIGSIYHLQGKHKEAIPYLKGYVEHMNARKVPDKEELKKHSIWLAESLKATNQFELAYDYLSAGKEIEINALEEETKALKNELRVKYETEKKDETIASQTEKIEQQRKIQWLTFAVGGLLFMLLGGLFYTYRNNVKRNNQLENLNQNLESTNLKLDKRNAENELLLKEIHHRVKNNLEVVSSLLELQSGQIDDPNIQNAMQASQNRVQSMGILHQKLYQSEHLAFIEMKNYFINLSENILDSYNERERIQVEFPMENLELDIDTAVPVGLIVNELVTNALKYAFPAGGLGKIKLSLHEIGANMLQLSISDNGVGKILNALPKGSGFGTQLVNLLTQQLNGQLTQNLENGTMITIQFARK
jgi:two-component sensor histidine kinase